jgi:antitoxin ParD1/3/4
MTTLNISLPDAMKDYVEQQVKSGMYSSSSDYIRALIREDLRSNTEQKLDALLLEGLDSGEPITIDDQYWDKKRADLTSRLQKQLNK